MGLLRGFLRRSPASIIPCIALLALAFAPSASASTSPTITEYGKGLAEGAAPLGIASGPDANLWFTQAASPAAIDRMTLAGGISSYAAGAPVGAVATAPDGKLWFTESGPGAKIGTVNPQSGVVTEYPLSGCSGATTGITAGPEGDVWFLVEAGTESLVCRIVPSSGEVTKYKGMTMGKPLAITAGPEGNLWFTESNGNGAIAKLDPSTKVIVEYTNGLTVKGVPTGITTGPEGDLWFTEATKEPKIGRMNPQTATITEFFKGLTSTPQEIVTGSDGNLYFTESSAPAALGQITPSGQISEFRTGLSEKGEPWGITSGPDGNIWFTEKGKPAKIGKLTVAPSVASPAAVNVNGQSATLTSSVGANAQATNFFFEYGPTPSYGFFSLTGYAGNARTPASVSAPISGLSVGATYHYRVVAYNETGTTYGADASFTATAPSQPAPSQPAPSQPAPSPERLPTGLGAPSPGGGGTPAADPVIGSLSGAAPASGTILVKDPSSGTLVPLHGNRTLPLGTVIDATNGVVRLVTALNAHGKTQSVTIWGGVFELSQSKSENGLTRIVLKGTPPSCGRGAHASSAKKRFAKSRKLWAADNHGSYSTYGANSVATVLGTKWETIDTCAGTLTRVVSGKVRVRDLHRHKTVVVSAGQSHLAPA